MSNDIDPEEAGQKAAQGENPFEGDDDDALIFEELTKVNGQQAQQLENIRTELSAFNSKLDNLINVLEGLRALNSDSSTRDSEAGDDGETDTTVTIEHGHDPEVLENEAYDWIQRAAEFNSDLLAEAVEIEFGQIEGEVGLIIESGAPWNVGCHNGNEWTDKERWDDHSEAFKSVMQSKDDEITYHGEPDYFNFLPAADAPEVF